MHQVGAHSGWLALSLVLSKIIQELHRSASGLPKPKLPKRTLLNWLFAVLSAARSHVDAGDAAAMCEVSGLWHVRSRDGLCTD